MNSRRTLLEKWHGYKSDHKEIRKMREKKMAQLIVFSCMKSAE
jgi:hypothetical protein